MSEQINNRTARKVYAEEVKKGERRSFRAWARRTYDSHRGDLKLTGKLAKIVPGHE